MKKEITLALLGLLSLAACREKDPPDETVEQGPVFRLAGTIDGMPQNFSAGENGYFMNTSWDQDALDVLEFTGDMKQSCNGCKQSLRVSLRNYKQTPVPDDFIVDSAFSSVPFNFAFEEAATAAYKVHFSGEGTAEATGHLWFFGDGHTSTLLNPVHEYQNPGKYTVSYTSYYSNGCNSTLSYPLNLAPHLAGKNNAGFGYSYLDNNEVRLFCNAGQDQILWDLGQGQFSAQPSVNLLLNTGVRLVSLKRMNKEGDTIEIRKNIASKNYLMCRTNFSHFARLQNDPLKLSSVSVEWTDSEGKIYSSKKVAQTSVQSFRILSSSPYMRNEKGQKTRKLKVLMNCLLSDGNKTIEIKNMSGTIAVAHP